MAIKSLSTINKESTDAFIKCLAALLLYYEDEITPPDVKKKLSGWLSTAQKFGDAFKTKSLAKCVRYAMANAEPSEEINDHLYELGVEIASAKEKLVATTSISREQLNLLLDLSLWLRTDSETAVKRIQQKVSMLGDSDLNQAFLKETGNQNIPRKALETLVKKVTGKQGMKLSLSEATNLRAKKPEAYKHYLALRRDLLEVSKNEIRAFIRNSGEETVLYTDLMKHLAKKKLVHNLPDGYVGRIDENGKPYTLAGRAMKAGLPLNAEIKMNPAYNQKLDNTYVYSATSEMGTSRQYTAEYVAGKTKEKFKKVEKLEDTIEAGMRKWRQALLQDQSRVQILAAAVEVLFETQARIGTIGNSTDGKATQGISTLQVKNVKFLQGGKLRLSYSGKSGVAQKHDLSPTTSKWTKKVIQVITKLTEGKKPGDPLWTYQGKSFNASSINAYFKSLVGVTVHKIRHFRGSKIAREILSKSPLKKGVSQNEAERWFKEAMTEVGKALSHIRTSGGVEKTTGATAIGNYIDPGLMTDFFTKLGLRIPNFIPK